jgi:DNA-binding GntR family transcriptional regulator
MPTREYSTLREWAYGQLRERIITGDLPPGADIHEGRLAAELEISKSPLREALRQLAQEGLVVTTGQRGSRVAELAPEDIGEIYSLRQYVEALEVRLAAERITPEQIAELRANVAEMEGAMASGDVRRAAALDVQFHLALARVAGHKRLLRMQQALQADMHRLVIYQFEHFGQVAESSAVQKHNAIIDALAARDADRAEREMRSHLVRSEERRRGAFPGGASCSSA